MDSSSHGLAEKNAAGPKADLDFIAGRGCHDYPNGVIEMAHVTVDHWAGYERCNHAPGSTHYVCAGGSEYAGKDAIGRYSFPAKGQNKHWFEKGTVRKSVHDVYKSMGCSGGGNQCACVSSKRGNIAGFLKAFGQLDLMEDINSTMQSDNSTVVLV